MSVVRALSRWRDKPEEEESSHAAFTLPSDVVGSLKSVGKATIEVNRALCVDIYGNRGDKFTRE